VNFEAEILGIICGIMLVFGIGFAAGSGYSDATHRRDLVHRGVAEWVVDKDGNVEFKWKEDKP
jgi:hypothetical protein